MAPLPDKQRRIHCLDTLRSIAAVVVVLFHFNGWMSYIPFSSWLDLPTKYGFLAVDFFFVMSGYILAEHYLERLWRGEFLAFVIHRVARLAPLHLVTLFAMVMLLSFGQAEIDFKLEPATAPSFLANVFLAHNIGFGYAGSFNSPSWSISSELYVNICCAAAIALGARKWFFVGALVFFTGFLIVTSGGFGNWNKGYLGIISDGSIRCFIGIIVGGFAQRVSASRSLPTTFYDILFVAGVGSLHYAIATPHGDFILTFLSFPAIVVGAGNGRVVELVLGAKLFRPLGEASYSIYLCHLPLLYLICLSPSRATALRSDTGFSLFLIVLFAIAIISSRTIENYGRQTVLSLWRRFDRRLVHTNADAIDRNILAVRSLDVRGE